MTAKFEPSITIKAEDLFRIDHEIFDFEELKVHKYELESIYSGLLSKISNTGKISRDERVNLKKWLKKIQLKLARTNDLIQAFKSSISLNKNGSTSFKNSSNSVTTYSIKLS